MEKGNRGLFGIFLQVRTMGDFWLGLVAAGFSVVVGFFCSVSAGSGWAAGLSVVVGFSSCLRRQ